MKASKLQIGRTDPLGFRPDDDHRTPALKMFNELQRIRSCLEGVIGAYLFADSIFGLIFCIGTFERRLFLHQCAKMCVAWLLVFDGVRLQKTYSR